MTSILVIIGRIYRYQFKRNYIKNKDIFRIYIKFWTFWKKIEPHNLNICEIIDSERRGYRNA